MSKLAIWPGVINSITVRRKKTSKKVGELTKERENETWIFRISPGNENFAGQELVYIRFKGTHVWPGQKRFQDLLKDKTFKDGELEINELPGELSNFGSTLAWDPNRPYGTACIVFASVPFNPECPEEEWQVWDPDTNKPVVDKNNKPLIRTQDIMVITGVWAPNPETGEGMWISEYGASLEEGLRTEMSTAITRNRYKPLNATKKTIDLGALAALKDAAKAEEATQVDE